MGGERIAKTLTRSTGGGSRLPDAVGRRSRWVRLVRRLRLGSYPAIAPLSPASICSAACSCSAGIACEYVFPHPSCDPVAVIQAVIPSRALLVPLEGRQLSWESAGCRLARVPQSRRRTIRTVVPLCPDLTLTSSIRRSMR